MTKLAGAQSEQVAMVTPSPPASVSVSNASPVARTYNAQPAAPPASMEEVEKAAQQLEAYMRSIGKQLEFHVDESTGRTVTTVKDVNTGEVVRQIPNEETLRLARTLGAASHALVDLEA